MNGVKKILRTVDLFFVFSGVFTYLLGAVLARRSGGALNAAVLVLGLIFFLLLYLLERSFNYLTSSRISLFSKYIRNNKLSSADVVAFLLFLSFSLVFCLYYLLREGGLSPKSWLWLALLAFGLLINITAIRLWGLPYRWLTDALVAAPLALFSGAVLQKIASERMLFFLSLPLFFLFLASSSALLYEKYEADSANSRPSLLTVIGWERAMTLHHVLLLCAYLCFGIYFYISGSWSIAWPVVFMASISLLEVFQLERIARGLKPLWGVLRVTAVFQYLGALYILLFAFLTR
ncbi:MAG: hypothetical protein GX415_02110 [Chloroflexi bacterium]|jgi:1,4-dihydroxy-2-naphthoate octaprenyltransferase|nr:hypothetical protein [Chloroflexota bacterium]